LIALFALAAGAAGTAALPAQETVAYVVQPGDSFSALAQHYIVPEHGWRDLMRLTAVRQERHLPAGMTIKIPLSWLRWTLEHARIVSARGTVTVTIGGKTVTTTANANIPANIPEGAQIQTAANSFATLTLTNGSRITLPSHSQVVIERLRKYALTKAIDYRFSVDEGRIDTRVTPLTDPSGRYIITTPLAMTAVRGTEYAVAFDAKTRRSGMEVFEGLVALSPPDGGEAQFVPKAFGATTDASGRSEKTELLPAPALTDPGRVQSDDLVRFDVTPIAGAAGYRLRLATDAGFIDSYREEESATPHFALSDIPDGRQFVRISALAGNGLESQRESYSFQRRLASVQAQAGATAEGYRFKWFGAGEGEHHYRLEIFRDTIDSTPIVDEVGLTQQEVLVRDLPDGVYYWRVTLSQRDEQGLIESMTPPEKLTISGASSKRSH
jgi:hypothetical protein